MHRLALKLSPSLSLSLSLGLVLVDRTGAYVPVTKELNNEATLL